MHTLPMWCHAVQDVLPDRVRDPARWRHRVRIMNLPVYVGRYLPGHRYPVQVYKLRVCAPCQLLAEYNTLRVCYGHTLPTSYHPVVLHVLPLRVCDPSPWEHGGVRINTLPVHVVCCLGVDVYQKN